MENQEMYKLGFELALKQAGLVNSLKGKLKGVGKTLYEETPNLRAMIGYGNDATVGARGMKPTIGKAYKQTPADLARRARTRASQPQGSYSILRSHA
jgi:hypothetical protein